MDFPHGSILYLRFQKPYGFLLLSCFCFLSDKCLLRYRCRKLLSSHFRAGALCATAPYAKTLHLPFTSSAFRFTKNKLDNVENKLSQLGARRCGRKIRVLDLLLEICCLAPESLIRLTPPIRLRAHILEFATLHPCANFALRSSLSFVRLRLSSFRPLPQLKK